MLKFKKYFIHILTTYFNIICKPRPQALGAIALALAPTIKPFACRMALKLIGPDSRARLPRSHRARFLGCLAMAPTVALIRATTKPPGNSGGVDSWVKIWDKLVHSLLNVFRHRYRLGYRHSLYPRWVTFYRHNVDVKGFFRIRQIESKPLWE